MVEYTTVYVAQRIEVRLYARSSNCPYMRDSKGVNSACKLCHCAYATNWLLRIGH